ncbi:MAG TPA: hypothetical protein VLT81_11010, partial [Chondromyces sp.]|nr:hypothetical protein [Chondromyces sp.]
MMVLVLAAAGTVVAQEAPPAADPQAVEGDEGARPVAVGEITVTARKVEENIQDVPISISTLQGEDLDILTTGGADVRA